MTSCSEAREIRTQVFMGVTCIHYDPAHVDEDRLIRVVNEAEADGPVILYPYIPLIVTKTVFPGAQP